MIELLEAACFDIDDQLIREDLNAESVTIFCQQRPVVIGPQLIIDLKRLSSERRGKIFRFCLHEGPENTQHDMIILQNEGPIFRPHRHREKEEVHHVIEGKLAIFVFEEDGAIAASFVLEPGQLDRIGKNMFHTVCPITPYVIYHENKPGPFQEEDDAEYPSWAPKETDLQSKEKFDRRLLKILYESNSDSK